MMTVKGCANRAVDWIRRPGGREVQPLARPCEGAVEQIRLPFANLFPDRIGPVVAGKHREAMRFGDW